MSCGRNRPSTADYKSAALPAELHQHKAILLHLVYKQMFLVLIEQMISQLPVYNNMAFVLMSMVKQLLYCWNSR